MNYNKKCFCIVLLLCICTTLLFAEGTKEQAPKQVKALVFGMFEIGKPNGDFAGEFQHFYEYYFEQGNTEYTIPGCPEPVYLNGNGVMGTTAGMGKAQAASTLTAILSDKRFDFSTVYIVVCGCGGGDPARITLGDVIIATYLVDYELGNGWQQSDTPAGTTATFKHSDSYDNSAFVVMDKALVEKAYALTKDIALDDSQDAAKYRALYSAEEATEKPSVKTGISVTADSYWHGPASAKRADEICAIYTTDGAYMDTQMEDNGFGVVAKNFGKLDHLLVIRDIVNYDRPHQGQTVLESLDASSGAFSMGMTNGFKVASAIIDNLVK